MKFKFCADGDCPLWALSALHTLSALPADTFRTLLNHVMEEQPDDGIMEILKETNLCSRSECARAAGVLRWTVTQAQRSSCPPLALQRDLLVLGLPRPHAAALAAVTEEKREEYRQHVEDNGLMLNKLTDASASQGPGDTVRMKLTSDDVTGETSIDELVIDKTQVKVLLRELKEAVRKMDDLGIE